VKLLTDVDNYQGVMPILIVDDDAFNLFALRQVILTLGKYMIDTAMNGKEAI
jgi:CheY-like chemotaxis protein